MKQYTALVLTIFFSTIAFGMNKKKKPVSLIKTRQVMVCPQPKRCIPGMTIDFSALLQKKCEDPKDITNYYCIPQNRSGSPQLCPYTISLQKLHSKKYDSEVAKALFNEWKPKHNEKEKSLIFRSCYLYNTYKTIQSCTKNNNVKRNKKMK